MDGWNEIAGGIVGLYAYEGMLRSEKERGWRSKEEMREGRGCQIRSVPLPTLPSSRLLTPPLQEMVPRPLRDTITVPLPSDIFKVKREETISPSLAPSPRALLSFATASISLTFVLVSTLRRSQLVVERPLLDSLVPKRFVPL